MSIRAPGTPSPRVLNTFPATRNGKPGSPGARRTEVFGAPFLKKGPRTSVQVGFCAWLSPFCHRAKRLEADIETPATSPPRTMQFSTTSRRVIRVRFIAPSIIHQVVWGQAFSLPPGFCPALCWPSDAGLSGTTRRAGARRQAESLAPQYNPDMRQTALQLQHIVDETEQRL